MNRNDSMPARERAPAGIRRVLYTLLTALLGFLMAVTVVEVAMRLLRVKPGGLPLRRVEIDRGHGYEPASIWGTAPLKQPSPFPGVKNGEYIPNLDFRFVYASNPRGYFDADNAVTNHINRYGIRGRDFAWEKPAHVLRIMVLGDSFTFGEGVWRRDTFCSRLERKLSRPNRPVEVINCGVSSYNTADEVINLEQRWVKARPDLVLIVFVLNDAYDDSVFGPMHRGYVQGLTRIRRNPYLWGSRLLAWSYDKLQRRRIGRQTAAIYRAQFSKHPLLEGHNWEDCRQALERAVDLANQQHFRIGLVLFPELYRLNRYPFKRIHAQVRAEAARSGLPMLDLLDVFEGRRDSDLWAHPTDHHPNAEAHRLAADALYRFVTNPQRPLLDSAADSSNP